MRRLALLLLASLTLLAACRDAKVASYRVPKEKSDALPQAAAGTSTNAPTIPGAGRDMAGTAVLTAAGAGLTWSAPAHWKPKAASAMRKASFDIPGADGTGDLSITAFPGDVGGELANVNRWRGQIGLPPLGENALATSTTRLEQNGLTFTVVDFVSSSGEKPARILGAIVPFNGSTWFVKLTGPDAVVAAEKPAFLAFLQTVKAPTGAAASTEGPAVAAVPLTAPGSDMASTAVPTTSGSDLTWQAPADWKAKAAGAIRKGSFDVPGAGGVTADLSITSFPGAVGGDLANLNRWRGQIQLPPLADKDVAGATTRVEQNGLTFIVVDFVSPSAGQPVRILGAIVPYRGATWFFKLMGPDAAVTAAKPAFLAFLQTVKAPSAP
jgi:hypothetical protein